MASTATHLSHARQLLRRSPTAVAAAALALAHTLSFAAAQSGTKEGAALRCGALLPDVRRLQQRPEDPTAPSEYHMMADRAEYTNTVTPA